MTEIRNRMRKRISPIICSMIVLAVVGISCSCSKVSELSQQLGFTEESEQSADGNEHDGALEQSANGNGYGGFLEQAVELAKDSGIVQSVTGLFIDQEKAEAERREKVSKANDASVLFSGYSYVDFSEVNCETVFADERPANEKNESFADENSVDESSADERKRSALAAPGYCYSMLNDSEKETYEELYLAILTFQENYRMKTKDLDQIRKVYYYVMADHPELFWLDGFVINTRSKGEKTLSHDFTLKKTMEKEEVQDWQKKIRRYLSDFSAAEEASGIDQASDTYDRIHFTFDYIVHHTDYVDEAPLNQTICSVFGNGESVCQGYSVAMQYLLQYQGIQSITVSGTTSQGNSSHAWNMVQGDGEWYWLDVTWGDPGFQDADSDRSDLVNYTYFCVTDEELGQTHVPDDKLELPECTAHAYNYYIHEGRYYDSWDRSQFEKSLEACIGKGLDYMSVRFSDKDIYDEAMNVLLEEEEIFHCLEAAGKDFPQNETQTVSYYENPEKNIVTFMWK